MIEGWKKDPANTRSINDLFDAYIAFYNDCFKRPADMHLGIHLCRGNFVNSRHFSEGGYDRIAKKLFKDLNVSTYYLEYDTGRAGGFEPLKELPKNKNVILGKLAQLHSPSQHIDPGASWTLACANALPQASSPASSPSSKIRRR
jgi:methionine synthase II (cobalamin-independent)